MSQPKLVIALIIIAVLGFLASATLFTVHQTQQALVLQFGDPRRVIDQPGLNFKMPFVQNIIYIDKRILDLDSPTEELIAADQKRLVVDAYTRYRIKDPLQFFTSLRDSRRANSRLAAIVSSSMRSVVGEAPFEDIVRTRRDELMSKIRELVNEQANDFGIEIVDVRIRRADLPEANSQAIYRRMQTEREQEAAEFRAKGQEVSRGIRAQADKDVTVLTAKAQRDSEIIRGQGDSCRNRIFAAAYGQDPDFFAFYRSMQSYETALEDEGTTLVLSPDSAFFKYLNAPDTVFNKRVANSTVKKSRVDVASIVKSKKSLQEALCYDLVTNIGLENTDSEAVKDEK